MKTVQLNEKMPNNSLAIFMNYRGKKYSKGMKVERWSKKRVENVLKFLNKNVTYTLERIK